VLTEEVKQVGGGELEYVQTIHTGDEIEELSQSFGLMTRELKDYMNNLAKVTADKERIATELNVATQIQASMLPCIFPPFPEVQAFDIYATMQPAKEVGGDFYDFFLVDNDHFAVVVADVSGKGVPAALFMVIAKTLIKTHVQNGEEPHTAITAVNAQLCETNDMGMFVTAFMGILEISTGRFTFVNAGHNPPVIRRNGASYEYLKARAGFVLAGMEGMKYKPQETSFKSGDRLYLYTDGVTEAVNKENELFGEERLVQVLNKTDDMSCMEMLPFIKNEIDTFADGAEQFDDITMLVLDIK
jgi:sigma-B regulation protein RsbU (phosphoserine phosphatase)